MTAADRVPGRTPPGPAPDPRSAAHPGPAPLEPPLAGPALLVAGLAAATYSVVRFDLLIVGTYLALLVLLLAQLLAPGRWSRRSRPGRDPSGRLALGGALVLAAAAGWLVPGFTYLDGHAATQVRAAFAVAALAAALALALPWRRASGLALGAAVCGYLVAAVAVLHGDPAPRIDVWYSLQGAADGLAAGQDVYRQTWVGPPGVLGAFTYLPWTAVLLAPGRWLAGDVRVSLAVLTLATAGMLCLLSATGRDGARRGLGIAALLLLLPGTPTQVEQAWTEPLLLAELAGFALAVARRRPGWAVLALALALASKQHIALVLPVLAAWPGFGWRRAASAALGAAALVLPWLLADPRALLDDTVGLLVRFPVLRFADSLYTASINELGWTPPFWATGVVVLLAVALACSRVRRREVGLGGALRWCAAVLLVANLVNKQAFYNQYWLVAALVLLSWATPDPAPDRLPGPVPEPVPDRSPAAAAVPPTVAESSPA